MIGLPDIIAYFYYVFIDMINKARTSIQNRKHYIPTKPPEEEIFNIDLKLPLEGLEEPYPRRGGNTRSMQFYRTISVFIRKVAPLVLSNDVSTSTVGN
jgi:hypothetical protein